MQSLRPLIVWYVINFWARSSVCSLTTTNLLGPSFVYLNNIYITCTMIFWYRFRYKGLSQPFRAYLGRTHFPFGTAWIGCSCPRVLYVWSSSSFLCFRYCYSWSPSLPALMGNVNVALDISQSFHNNAVFYSNKRFSNTNLGISKPLWSHVRTWEPRVKHITSRRKIALQTYNSHTDVSENVATRIYKNVDLM